MDFLVELLLQMILEGLFQIVGTLIGERIAPLSGGVFALKILLYSLLGVLLGYASFSVYPTPLMGVPPNALLSLGLIPLSMALMFVILARLWERRTHRDIEMARFGCSLAFAWWFEAARYQALVGISV